MVTKKCGGGGGGPGRSVRYVFRTIFGGGHHRCYSKMMNAGAGILRFD